MDKNYNIKLKQLQELENTEIKNNLEKFFTNVYNFLCKYYSDVINSELLEKINSLENKLRNLSEKQIAKEYIYNTNQVNESNIKVNPITYNNVKQQLSISSQYKKALPNENHNSSNFIVELPETINNVISLELVNSELPCLMYTFSQKKSNNIFVISISTNKDEHDINYIIRIPDGVWFATDFETYLNENYFDYQDDSDTCRNRYLRYMKFEIPSWDAKPVFRFKTSEEVDIFNATYSKSCILFKDISLLDMKYSLYNINNDSLCINNERTISILKEDELSEVNFSLSCLGTIGFTIRNTYSNSCFIKIGFNDPNYKNDIKFNTYYGYLQAENIYGHTNISSFYISVNDFVGNQSQQILLLGSESSLICENVLSRIQITNSPFQNNIYSLSQNYGIKRNYNGPVRIRKLHIRY